MSEREDDFLTGEEADLFLGDNAGQKVKVEVAKHNSATPYKDAIDILEEALRSGQVADEEISSLADLIPSELLSIEEVDAEFDMMAELAAQRNIVNALRAKVTKTGGRGLRDDVSISEAKSVMDACGKFGEVIRKNMKDVLDLGRVQALQAAIMSTVSGYPEEFRREFLGNLEKQLAIHCKEKQ